LVIRQPWFSEGVANIAATSGVTSSVTTAGPDVVTHAEAVGASALARAGSQPGLQFFLLFVGRVSTSQWYVAPASVHDCSRR
jgi:hypothetical protein